MDKKKKGIIAAGIGVAASAVAALFIKKKVDSKNAKKEK